MKGIIAIVSLILVVMAVPFAGAQVAGGMMTWEFEKFNIEVYTQPQNFSELSSSLPMIAGMVKADTWFGLRYAGVDPYNFWVYELYDETAKTVIKRINLSEILGLETRNGCKMILDDQVAPDRIVTNYMIEKGKYQLVLKRSLSLIDDPNLPGGKRLILTYSLENKKSDPIKLKMTERWVHDDLAVVEGNNSIMTISEKNGGYPILVQVFDGDIESMRVSSDEQTTSPVSVTVWRSVDVVRTYRNPTVYLGSISFGVATTEDADYVMEQASNIANYLATGNPKPQLVVDVTLNKWEAFPGEEVVYSLTCLNNGTGKAVDGAVIEGIPEMVEYIIGSATGDGTQISFSTDGGQTFQESVQDASAVTHIKWFIPGPMAPAETIRMEFRAKVKEAEVEG